MTTAPQLGKRYRDTISGFEGVATGRFEYLHGCIRWQLSGTTNGNPESFVFDEPQIMPVPSPVVHEPTRGTGGPRDDPPRTGAA